MAEPMESASCSEPKRSYSWWWDSHITPKNSKWLQENLTDMDNKIKSMIKLMEEDADSFARKAEMYYKKRPEFMKLVEEFYRAYRALAERYDHVTGALRQAHQTIAVAFPSQIQLILPDEPPSGLPDSVEEEKETFDMPSYADEEARKKFAEGLLMKGLNLKEEVGKFSELKKLEDEVSQLSTENKNLKNQITSESMRADKAETESQSFKDAVSQLKSQLEATFLQYQVSQEMMSYLEAEISQSREEARHLNDKMSIKVTKHNIAEERCHDLEKENTSLWFELNKFNEAVPRQMEDVSDLFKENQKLHNKVKLESIRGEQAEAESCRLRDAISKLKSEMETALLQYKVSQERISDLEAEISRAGEQFQSFNVEMSIRSSKINMAEEQYIILQEENKSLQSTIDKFKIIVERQAEEAILKEEELCKLKQFVEDEHQRYKYAGIQEYMSLQMELNKFKQRVTGQKEELAAGEKELDKLKQSLEDERNRRIIAEVANHSLKILYSQSVEEVRLLGMEIRRGTELLRRIELSKNGLEEEIMQLHDEKKDLSEKNFDSVSKIGSLQDEINSLKRSNIKISDKLSFHLDENGVLQQELSSLKNERNNLEERHHELMEQMEEINFNMVSVRALVQELVDGKKELKDAYKKHEGEKVFNLEDLRTMESISEKNSLLVNSLSDVNAELDCLRAKIKGLEEYRESLHGNAVSHSEKAVLASHAETVNQNIKKLSEKNALFENSLSDIFVDFEGLRGKVKSLEESCQSLFYQNCYLIAENSNLVAQVEKIEQQMESLESRFSTFEGKLVNMEKEKNLALHQVKELKDLLRSGKEEHEKRDFFFKNQTSALHNQILLLKEKEQLINEDLEEEHKTVKSGIDCFILQRVLHDINEKNLILSDECQKYMEKLRRAEKNALELKQDQSAQEKKLTLLFDHNKKLSEWVHVMVRAFDAEEDNGISKIGNKNIVQLISHNMIDLQASVSDSKEEFYHIHLEKSPFAVLLEQLGLGLVELRAQKNVLEQEYEKKNQENSVLHSKNNELMNVNDQLGMDLNASNQQKEELRFEMGKICQKLSDLQEAQCTSEGKIPKLFADALQEETEAVLEEAMIHEQLSCIFRTSDPEKISGIDKLISDVHNLHGITNDLGQDIRVINENMRGLQTENMHLRDFANFGTRYSVLLEDGNDHVSNVFGKQNTQTKAEKNLLEQKDIEWSDANPSFQSMQLKNKELCKNLEGLMVEFNKANVVGEELEKKILVLLEENVRRDDEIEFRHQSNGNFVGELSRLHKEAEALREREMNLTSELQRVKNESRCFEEESAEYLLDIYGASINELVFRQKFDELMLKVKNLEASDSVQSEMPIGEISLTHVQREDLMEKLNALERENKGLKAELSACLPLLVSVDNDIASLEERSLSLANHHILSSQRKQGNNLLASLQHKRFSQVRGKDHTSKVSAGIMELKKLHAKVKQLQKTVITDTERLLAEEEIVVDANLACETRKIKVGISKGSARQLETQKKNDIVFDSRKGNADDKDVRLMKIDQEVSKVEHEQRMKDIELDHVSSSFRSEDDFNPEINEQSREMLEPVTDNVIEYQKIEMMEEERSEYPSFEIVLDKEWSVDKLELPINGTESHQEWSRRVGETLSSDALRLSILQKKIEELKKSINVSEMSSQSLSSALNSVSEQLKVLEGFIMELIDINFKLTKMADNFSVSLDDNVGRRKISERAQRASKKISGVELELQNTQSILSKLLEEQESKAVKAMQWKSRIPLKYFIYWKRNVSRQKKRRFCACMRLNTMGA